MNGVTLNTRTGEDIIEFPQVDFEIVSESLCPVIHCAPTPPISAIGLETQHSFYLFYFMYIYFFFQGVNRVPSMSLAPRLKSESYNSKSQDLLLEIGIVLEKSILFGFYQGLTSQ